MLAVVHLEAVILATWLLFGDGLVDVAGWLHTEWSPGNGLRRAALLACSATYLLRLLGMSLVFVERRVDWLDAILVGAWVLVIHVAFAFSGGRDPDPPGLLLWAGLALYAAGSVLNTRSEFALYRWRQHPGNRGHLCTDGPFQTVMHPNFLGELTLVTGFALVSGNLFALALPGVMLVFFATIHVPLLDRHLASRFGAEYEGWSRRAWRLVPFLY